MATQITCIVPDSSSTPNRRIDGVGGDGWTKGEDRVIAEIEEGVEYYVEVAGGRASVVVEETTEGLKFLKTEPDDFPPKNLFVPASLHGLSLVGISGKNAVKGAD